MDFDTTTRNENVRQSLCPIARALIKGSGNASVDLHRGLCVIDNVGCGFDLYKMDSGTFVRGLVTREPSKTYPKAVTFADNSRAIVGGSDHGLIYIFERKTGKLIQSLRHAKNGGVQTVAVSEHDWGERLLSLLITRLMTATMTQWLLSVPQVTQIQGLAQSPFGSGTQRLGVKVLQ